MAFDFSSLNSPGPIRRAPSLAVKLESTRITGLRANRSCLNTAHYSLVRSTDNRDPKAVEDERKSKIPTYSGEVTKSPELIVGGLGTCQ